MKKALSVIVPVFNEENTIERIIQKVLKQNQVLEIIIVDDGSTDGSISSIKKINNSKMKIVKHQKNQGKGAAIITGLKHAKGTWMIVQDADLELNPEDFSKLLEPLKKNKADFVIGNRNKNNNGRFIFKLGSHIVTSLLNILFNFVRFLFHLLFGLQRPQVDFLTFIEFILPLSAKNRKKNTLVF